MTKSAENKNRTARISLRSAIGLNATNFFLAEVVGVIIPFLSAYLKQQGWRYDSVGIAIAIGGMGTFLMQIPAGIIADRWYNRRLMLAAMSLLLGASYALLPVFSGSEIAISSLLFVSGAASAFFVPLLATLALSLVGYAFFDRTMGINQGWNHAGNLAAALLALWLVKIAGIVSLFYVMARVSICAAASLLLIRKDELNPDLTQEKGLGRKAAKETISKIIRQVKWLLRDRTIRMLVISVALFHIANAPVMPLVGLYLKHLGGHDEQVALVVLIAQITMIPVALLAGRFCGSHGRKPVFAIAFLILPVRIFLYSLTSNADAILAIQALDGIGAGIYGVVIALICGDLTRGKAGFNTLLGIMQTALALGGVVGPLMQGFLTQHFGFPMTFTGFAVLAAIGAALFLLTVPETHPGK